MYELWKKRLSIKNIVFHIRQIIPGWMYEYVLWARLLTFPRVCDCLKRGSATYTDGEWIDRKVTKDQQAIEEYLSGVTLQGATMLHVGIGSSTIATRFKSQALRIVGITVVRTEIDFAQSLDIPNYDFFLLNKNHESLPLENNSCSHIIDNNLSSYACCMHGFNHMMQEYVRVLKPNGCIIIGHIGMKYFDSGFGFTNSFMKKFLKQHQLRISQNKNGVVILVPNPRNRQHHE